MASPQKIIELYKRAVEMGHPDPERGIIGRAALTGFDSSFKRDGKAGIFSIDEKRASRLGWDNLASIEESFQAAMELDGKEFQKSRDVGKMFMYTAGTKKDSFLSTLNSAFEDMNDRISYEDGVVADINLTKEEESPQDPVITDTGNHSEVQEDVKRETAMEEQSGADDETLSRLTNLLKDYIDASV